MASDSDATDLCGSTIGAYAVTALLGHGGMGVVYRAEQAPLGRPVALKVIHDHLAQDPATAERFLREAKIACSLKNPNTITIYDFGKSVEGRLYMAMELLEGQSLSARMQKTTVLEPAEAIEIATQVCRSLAEAHAKSIVHRDLKSDNVFLTAADDGSLLVKVLDYGIAHAGAAAKGGAGEPKPETLTSAGTLIGTPAYMAPEQARGEAVDGRADLWALGVILYEILTGVRPFDGDNPVVVLGKVLSDPPPPMASVGSRRRPPPELEALVDALLSKERDERPSSAPVVQARLRALAGGSGSISVPAAAPVSDDALLASSWALPVELATPTPVSPAAQTIAAPASTPPASAAPPPAVPETPAALTPVRTPPVTATGAARHRPPVEIEVPDDSFDHDFTPEPARIEVDRGSARPSSRARLDVDRPSRPSSAPLRPRPSRPMPSRAPERRGGAGIVFVVGLLIAGGGAAWFYFRPQLPFDGVLPGNVVPVSEPTTPGLGPTGVAPAPTPPEPTFSQAALERQEEALRSAGWTQVALPPGGWAGHYALEGGTLRLFDEGGRVTGTFEEALRSGGVQGAVRTDGVLEFHWRADATGAVGAAQGRTGAGTLRAWMRRGARKLVGTWGYGDSRDGALWVASPARPGSGKRPGR